MSERKQTKKALIMSVTSMVLCVAMLVGMTFAWFTDTASTGVNKIQAGNLKVDIVGEDGASIKNGTINFVNKDGSSDILWEPGATFKTTAFKIKNIGNLALKYKLEITDPVGDSKLLDALTFSVVNAEGTAVNIDTYEGTLQAKDSASASMYIQAKMDPAAGNDYQGLSLEGIKIKVYATQDTVENDSKDNQYDKDAKYAETIAAGKAFTGKATLDTGIIATNPNAIAVKAIGSDADVTITDGTFDGGNGGNNMCVAAANGAKVTIKGGTFTVGGDADGYGNSVVYSQDGNILIEGGFFQTDYNYRGYYYVLNQSNSNPGTITVKGGTFVNYDPSKGDDNLGGNFVADGYKVVSEAHGSDTWYTVVQA